MHHHDCDWHKSERFLGRLTTRKQLLEYHSNSTSMDLKRYDTLSLATLLNIVSVRN